MIWINIQLHDKAYNFVFTVENKVFNCRGLLILHVICLYEALLCKHLNNNLKDYFM